MEIYFDTLQEALESKPNALQENNVLKEMLQTLTTYYEGPDWRSDFESDERGELPQGLKRGVLSEDGIYNLLSTIK